jgi:hypothetical protein
MVMNLPIYKSGEYPDHVNKAVKSVLHIMQHTKLPAVLFEMQISEILHVVFHQCLWTAY